MVKYASVTVGTKVILNTTNEVATIEGVRVVKTGKRGRPAIWYTVGGREVKGADLSLPKAEPTAQ